MKRHFLLIVIAITVYLVWTFATYIFEGRINLLHRDDPLGRFEYTVIVNIIIGTVVAVVLVDIGDIIAYRHGLHFYVLGSESI